MCGIIGYVGQDKAVPYLLEGLEKLEYRGYDSAGIAVFENGKIKVTKTKGRLDCLASKLSQTGDSGSKIGIGHTRWATHGKPSDENAHPHLSENGLFCVVHNGIIENHAILKKQLQQDGFSFASETDTEVISQLLEKNYDGDFLSTVRKTAALLDGAYALAILCADFPDKIIFTKKESPLIIGRSKKGVFASSDVTAMLKYTNEIFKLENGETAVAEKDKLTFYDSDAREISKPSEQILWTVEDAAKGSFEHFMLKEISEQPKALRDTLYPIINDNKEISFGNGFRLSDSEIKDINKIIITACGSAYHVGLNGKHIIEKLTGIPVSVEIASEFRYSEPIIDKSTLVIVISQSGETADSLAALRLSNKRNAKTLGIVNAVKSSIACESQNVIYTKAGPEIAVATTKAYSAQNLIIYLLALYIAERKETICEKKRKWLVALLEELPNLVEKTLDLCKNKAELLSKKISNVHHCYFIGRKLDYACAKEASLKMKEISYIHCEAYAAGELKHGTISLIEKGTLVIALASNDSVFSKTLSNIREVKARGATVIAVSTSKHENELSDLDEVIIIPETNELFSSSLEVLPMQLLAYYTAKRRSCDIDKPRNLAKSVTVE